MQHPTFAISVHPAIEPIVVTNDFLGGIDATGEIVTAVVAMAVASGAMSDDQAMALMAGMDRLIKPLMAGHARLMSQGTKLN
jgi:hypothetical protein